MQVTNGQSGSTHAPAHPAFEPPRPNHGSKSPKYDPQAGTTRNDSASRAGRAVTGVDGAYDTNGNGSSTQRPPRNGERVDLTA